MQTEVITSNTYPTMAGVVAADVKQLEAWAAALPRPNSDVERSVRARIDRRLGMLADQARPGARLDSCGEDPVAQLRSLMGLLGDPSVFERGFQGH